MVRRALSTERLRNLPVVLADNDRERRALLERGLRALGYQVCACDSGGDVLRALKKPTLACVLSDQMPGWEGGKGVTLIRSLPSEVFVLLLLEETDMDEVVLAYRAGADEVLFHPATAGQVAVFLAEAERY